MKGNIWLGLLLGVVLGWLITWGAMQPKPAAIQTPAGTVMMTKSMTPKQFDMYQSMRKLWEDHVTWTRLVIIGIINNVPGNDKATARLLKNASDMANAIKPFYGDQAATKFQTLMEDHLKIAAQFVTEAKSGNKNAANTEMRWYKNADDIATFLSGANPNWPMADVKNMLYNHLKITKQEAVDRLTKNFDSEIKDYDNIVNQAMMMADTLSEGIIKQFPDKF